jgi:hypothetical protein
MTISTCGSIRIACDTVAARAFDDKPTAAPAALLTEQERGTRESQTQRGTGHVVCADTYTSFQQRIDHSFGLCPQI